MSNEEEVSLDHMERRLCELQVQVATYEFEARSNEGQRLRRLGVNENVCSFVLCLFNAERELAVFSPRITACESPFADPRARWEALEKQSEYALTLQSLTQVSLRVFLPAALGSLAGRKPTFLTTVFMAHRCILVPP